MQTGYSERSKGHDSWIAALLLGTALTSLTMASPVMAQQAGAVQQPGARSFNIAAQPLASALTQFGQQAGLQVSLNATTASGLSSPGVQGTLVPQQALDRLLSGTGLSYSFSGAATVIVAPAGAQELAPVSYDGSIVLEEVNVTAWVDAAGAGYPMTPDTPYVTAGSAAHVSGETLSRVPVTSPGDVFISTPGVISAGNRVGTSIQPNIRGLQGAGRVAVTVDGARMTTSSYRGYQGSRDETYLDPDLIAGIDITKGPNSSSGAIGTIGGTVGFRTISAEDLITDGKQWGIRVRGGWGNNTVAPVAGSTAASVDRSHFGSDTWSGSVAGAFSNEYFDGVLAFSRRSQGNYFAGTHVPKGLGFAGDTYVHAVVDPGAEVLNTSEDTTSLLAKGKLKLDGGHSLQLSYQKYDSRHGEIFDLMFSPQWTMFLRQWDLTNTRVDSYTANYRWNPEDNDLINLRANLWLSDVMVDRDSDGWGSRDHAIQTWGGDIGNTAIVDTGFGRLTLDGGGELVREASDAAINDSDAQVLYTATTMGPIGIRTQYGVFLNATFDPTDWLSVSGGLRYDAYEMMSGTDGSAPPRYTGGRFNPNVGVTVKPLDGLQLFALYKEGYRPPSLREMFWGSNYLSPNPNLEPETSKSFEIGANYLRDDVLFHGDSLRLKAAWFNNNYENYIIRTRVPGWTGPGSSYHWDNIDGATYQGIEFSGSYDAGGWFAEAAFTKYTGIEYCFADTGCGAPIGSMGGVGAGGTTDGLTTDYASNYIPPEYSGSLTGGVRLLEDKLTLGGRVHFASTRYNKEWNENGELGNIGFQLSWPSYAVYDVFATYAVSENVSLNLSIENLTDEYYFSPLTSVSIPAPGRTTKLTLTGQF